MTWWRDRRVLVAAAVALLLGGVVAVVVLVARPASRAAGAEHRVASATSNAATTALVIGDSLATVTAPAGPNVAYPLVAGRLLGWQVKLDARPGSGFDAPAGADGRQAGLAAAAGSAAEGARVVVVALGSDDAHEADPGRAVAVLTTASQQLGELHRRLPQARIVVVGPLPSGGTPSPALQAVRGALQIAANVAHVPFIDPVAEQWITGSRADPWSGNAAQMIAADGRHLTPAGHAYVGLRLASDLSRLGV
jgi:lysophospholipase L1-like esterase